MMRRRVTDRVSLAVAELTALADVAPAASDLRSAGALPVWQRAEHLAVRALLRMLLVDHVALADAAAPIATHPSGQPFLADRPDLAISLSHDGGYVAAALGVGVLVGIDVQRPVSVSTALARRCCQPAVFAELSRSPSYVRDLEFAWIWTTQEACVKATGVGLAGRPWTIPVDYGQRAGRWGALRWVSLRQDSEVPVTVAYEARAGSGSP